MNNFCRNCGAKLEDDVKVCPKCDTEVLEDRLDIDEYKKEFEFSKNAENKYVAVIIILFALSCLSFLNFFDEYNFVSYVRPLLFLSTIILLVYARINLNKSKKIRIVFNVFIFLLFLYLLFILIMYTTCLGVINWGCF